MNICLGGPWHGSKILKCPNRKKWFNVKDPLGNLIIYKKRQIKIGTRNYIFWVESSLTLLQLDELVGQVLRYNRY